MHRARRTTPSRPSGFPPIPPFPARPQYAERCRTAQSPAESATSGPVVSYSVSLYLSFFSQVLYLSFKSVSLYLCIVPSEVPIPATPLPIATFRSHGAFCLPSPWRRGDRGVRFGGRGDRGVRFGLEKRPGDEGRMARDE